MTRLPPCDFETLKRIETYAPHMLTPQDRRCLRLHRAAPAVRAGVPLSLVATALALVALIVWRH